MEMSLTVSILAILTAFSMVIVLAAGSVFMVVPGFYDSMKLRAIMKVFSFLSFVSFVVYQVFRNVIE